VQINIRNILQVKIAQFSKKKTPSAVEKKSAQFGVRPDDSRVIVLYQTANL